MLTKLLTRKRFFVLFVFVNLLFFSLNAFGQIQEDSLNVKSLPDSLQKSSSGFDLEYKVNYLSFDSVYMDFSGRKAFLFHNAEIQYGDIRLKADYIELDFKSQIVTAHGLPDSSGAISGKPIFYEGDQEFESDEISYSFQTKKGLINKVITQEGEGFVHGDMVKKQTDNTTNISGGRYTTCNHDHPHFQFEFRKAKVIPNKAIITGPTWLVIEDVPLPVALPFGYFPNTKGRASGVLPPGPGYYPSRGYGLENGGYYWALNDYMDLTLTGAFFTSGWWNANIQSSYNKRYKYKGNFILNYANNVEGVKGTDSYSKEKNFSIQWSHVQDQKARPGVRFSTSVNIATANYNRNNSVSFQRNIRNILNSSLNYSRRLGNLGNLSIGARHSQNLGLNTVNITMPEVNFSANQFYPFRKKEVVGKRKWYEKISVNYNANARSSVNTLDSTLFETRLKDLDMGAKQTAGVNSSVRFLKHFNFSNSINYTGRLYFNSLDRLYDSTVIITSGNDTTKGAIIDEQLSNINYLNEASFRSSVNTTIYGLKTFRKGPLRGIHHVMRPELFFNYRPSHKRYYGEYLNESEVATVYSYYENNIYGTPSRNESGSIGFNIGNNLEIKLRSKKDSVTGFRKVKLIESLNIGMSYDMVKDSMNLSPLNISLYTKLFKNVTLRYKSVWTPYKFNKETGTPIDDFIFEKGKKFWKQDFFRKDNENYNLSLSYNLKSKKGQARQEWIDQKIKENPEMAMYYEDDGSYIDFNNPWSLSFSYSLTYNNRWVTNTLGFENQLQQTLRLNGDVSITEKWKVDYQLNYDFKRNEVSHMNINIIRDLHCWEMRFEWRPLGQLKGYFFQLNVKSSMLQDLKLTKRRDQLYF